MFNFFKRKKKDGEPVKAIVDGKLIPITEVKDDVFSKKMLGDGYAIQPSNGTVYSPVDGVISSTFPTKHAIGIKTQKGLEILLHLGLDTVKLKGAPFDIKIQKGDSVKSGQELATMNLKEITDKGYDDVCIVVYTNMDLLSSVSEINEQNVAHGDEVQKIKYKQ